MWLISLDGAVFCRSSKIEFPPTFSISQTFWLSQSCSSTCFNHHGWDTLSPQKVHASWNSSKIPSRSAGITVGFLLLHCVFTTDCITSFGISLNSWHTAGTIIPANSFYFFVRFPKQPLPAGWAWTFICVFNLRVSPVHNTCCCFVCSYLGCISQVYLYSTLHMTDSMCFKMKEDIGKDHTWQKHKRTYKIGRYYNKRER